MHTSPTVSKNRHHENMKKITVRAASGNEADRSGRTRPVGFISGGGLCGIFGEDGESERKKPPQTFYRLFSIFT